MSSGKPVTEAEAAEIVEVYQLGYDVNAIASCANLSTVTVRRLLRVRGELRPKLKMTKEEKQAKDAARCKRYYLANKEKCVSYRKDYYETHKRDPGGQLDRAKAKYESNPVRWAELVEAKYQLSIDAWHEMLIQQSGRCAICLLPMQSPHVDHDHSTEEVRGLLCSHCNRGLGAFYDSPDSLERAAAYVRSHAKKSEAA